MALPRIPDADELGGASCSCDTDCCPGPGEGTAAEGRASYVDGARFASGRMSTPAGEIPVVSSRLRLADRAGTARIRLGIGRMRYAVAPGLYALGAPDPWSPVLVSANYKLSFDRLRRDLPGVDAWVMALDTRGINVWCAAGKGTFGTDEIVRRVGETGLKRIVSHRTLVLPQLGAPGVSAPEVARRTGFRVLFGPVRSADLKTFLESGMKATPEMRRVRFPFKDRLTLVPMELSGIVQSKIFLAALALWLGALIAGWPEAPLTGAAFGGAILAGAALTPALLPGIPGRMFAFRGAFLGLVWAAAVCLRRGFPPGDASSWAAAAAYLLLLPALSGFLAMNFTGSSTFTSLSGVVAEMKAAVPVMIAAGILGLAAAVASILLAI